MVTEDLVEIRIHGRGGQGAVLAATLGAEVAFRNGYYPQAFPFFGAERRGAPVVAFLRYSSSFLMPRSRIYEPHYVLVFDAELPQEAVLDGLREDGKLLINDSGKLSSWVKAAGGRSIYQIGASKIAAEYGLIASGMPLVSSVMIGALIRLLDLSTPDIVEEVLEGKFSKFGAENIQGARRGYQEVKEVYTDAAVQ